MGISINLSWKRRKYHGGIGGEEKRRACGLERRKSNSQNQNLERERAMDNEEIWAKIT